MEGRNINYGICRDGEMIAFFDWLGTVKYLVPMIQALPDSVYYLYVFDGNIPSPMNPIKLKRLGIYSIKEDFLEKFKNMSDENIEKEESNVLNNLSQFYPVEFY